MKRVAAWACLLSFAGCWRGSAAELWPQPEVDWAAQCDGELVLTLPELPFDLQRIASGGVLVVDRGGLAVRSETDFAIVRQLAPGIDGWHHGAFVADGGTWRGETFDGQRYDVDVATGSARRRYDARLSAEDRKLRERSFEVDAEHAFEEVRKVASQKVTAELERARVPVELVPELEATAALVDGTSLLLADTTGALWNIDLANKRVTARAACQLCSPKISLVKTASGTVALDRAGNVIELSASLQATREGPLRPQTPGNQDGLQLTRVFAVDGGRKLSWLASDGQHGLFDLERFIPRGHERPLGLGGVTGVSFWGEGRIALATQGAVEVRAIPSGTLLQRRAGNFVSVAGISDTALLAIRPDGVAQTLGDEAGPRCVTAVCAAGEARAPRAELLRQYQLALSAPALDAVSRAAIQRRYDGLGASRRFAHARSADGEFVAFVGWAQGTAVPGTLTVYKVGDWQLLLSEEVSAQFAPAPPRWEADGSLTVASLKFQVPGSGAQRGTLDLEKKASADGGYDWVLLSRGDLHLVVSDEVAGPQRRAQLHRESLFDVSPGGRGYVIAGGSDGVLPAGPLSVFCAPTSNFSPRFPPVVHVPAVAELDGVLEVALDALPPRYESLAAQPDGTAWVLGVDDEDRRVLAQLKPESTTAQAEPLPSAAQYSRLTVAGDGSLWALSGQELSRRRPDGAWTTLPLGVEGEFKQVVPLPNGGVAAIIEAKTGQRELVIADTAVLRRQVSFTREVPPLIALPDGVLLPADPRCRKAPSCEGGFVVRDGKVDAKDPLVQVVSSRRPLNGWLRGGELLLLGQRWATVDVLTGKVTEELSPQVVFRKRKHPVGPRPAPTPYLDRLEVELIRFVDKEGRPLALAALRGPAWIPDVAQALDAVDTDRGTWTRKGTLSVMFWDGTNLTSFFHPKTRERQIAQMK